MSSPDKQTVTIPRWKNRLHEIIFEADTTAGKIFDVVLLLSIICSVVLICLESMVPRDNPTPEQQNYLNILNTWEWVFTIMFTVEYLLRILCVQRPLKYICSFYGIVDLLALLPSYLALVARTDSSLGVVRSLRLLRALRVYKLVWLMSEADEMWNAIRKSRGKVIVFLGVVVIAVTVAGTAMYEIEGPESGFDTIPDSMYWAVVTVSTVGYGDITPQTTAGKVLTSFLILLGYSLIIVPTGFVTTEFLSAKLQREVTTQACPHCIREGHDADAVHCKFCGEILNPTVED